MVSRNSSAIRPFVIFILTLMLGVWGCGKSEYDSRMKTRIQELRTTPATSVEDGEAQAETEEAPKDNRDDEPEDEEEFDDEEEEFDDEEEQ